MKNLEILLLSILVLFSLNNEDSSELYIVLPDIETTNTEINSETGLTQMPNYSNIASTNIGLNSDIVSTNIPLNSDMISTNLGLNSDIVLTNIGSDIISTNLDIITTSLGANSDMISTNIGSNSDIVSTNIGSYLPQNNNTENENENINKINKTAPNRGLSDGAIAGIIIGCVLTIFSIIVVIVLLRGRNAKSPPKLNSQLDMYSHVSKSSQQNIEEQ